MADDKSKQIPIEDGKEEAEKEAKAKAKADEETEKEAKADDEAEKEAKAKAKADEEAKKLREEIEKEKAKRKKVEEKSSEEAKGEDESPEEAAESEKDAEAEESERYMRLMAEFQNFKRRAAKEKTDIHAYANEKLVSDILPVLDNFERALDTASDEAEGVSEELKGYAKGMQLIFEQLRTALENAGLKEIEALGCDFDPNVHNAVMTENLEDFESDKISKVLQKGYKLNDKVVRPSMVAVNKK